MNNKELIERLRERIDPYYAVQRGTESHERKLCADAIEAAVLEAQKQEPFPFSAERVTYHKTEAIVTIMPCGTMVTNVKEAYEAGKKQSFAHPFNPSLQAQ